VLQKLYLKKTFKTSSKLIFNELKWLSHYLFLLYKHYQTPNYVKELLTLSNYSVYNLMLIVIHVYMLYMCWCCCWVYQYLVINFILILQICEC